MSPKTAIYQYFAANVDAVHHATAFQVQTDKVVKKVAESVLAIPETFVLPYYLQDIVGSELELSALSDVAILRGLTSPNFATGAGSLVDGEWHTLDHQRFLNNQNIRAILAANT